MGVDMKTTRQKRICELIKQTPIYTHDDLRKGLALSGIRVNQATLSRDLRELGLLKTADGYALPSHKEDNGFTAQSLSRLVKEFVVDVREAANLLVLKTMLGSAQPVALCLDASQWQEVMGTVAGDDTILVITKSKAHCHKVAQRIREYLAQ